jgi:hypothetical protein
MNTVAVPVRDLAAAKAVHGTLLGAPHTDQPHYVGGGKLIATVADADGNPVGLMQSP